MVYVYEVWIKLKCKYLIFMVEDEFVKDITKGWIWKLNQNWKFMYEKMVPKMWMKKFKWLHI